MRIFTFITLLIAITLLLPETSRSCPIPVFRYALEYWEADPYSIEIFYKNSLDPEDEKKINNFLITSDGSRINVNLQIKKIDVEDDLDDASRRYINYLKPSEYPWLVLRYPYFSGINKILWSGSLKEMNINDILLSPARYEIAEMLAGETTAVWILLESGDKKKDQEAFNLLDKELKRLEQTLKLPDPELWWDGSSGRAKEKIPRINFNIARVSRNDPAEEYLVNMLLNSEKDLSGFESEPILFPVYGRGIALYAIVGKGINEWNITEAASFLTGPCSCQAKLLNPGTDLLISMDWDKLIDKITDISIANPLSGIGDFTNREEEVKRQLELATMKRMGSEGINISDIPGNTGRTLQQDTSRNNTRETQNDLEIISLDGKPIDAKKTANKKKNKNQDTPGSLVLQDDNIQQLLTDDKNKGGNLLKMPVIIFSVGIVLVLLIGVILYKKSIK